MRQQNELDQNVKERVMKVAGRLFSEKGFARVTVREICQTAEANIAAINYYFRNKENLYVEVVKHWQRVAFEKFPFTFAQDETNPPEERLRNFIQCQLMQTLYRIESPWFSTFISRENIESSRAIEELVTEGIGPSINLLFDIVKQMMGQGTPDSEVRYYCA
ncbi:MAG: TetR/AcrR family transcriptional regulator, partial [Treponema sp.]|nr:TetR/AcrR family transcriptional regulator [Treponema sp.]